MTWKVYGRAIGDEVDVYQPFQPSRNTLLAAIRTQFIFANDPTFTAISLQILNSDGNIIATSDNSKAKTDVVTKNSGVYDLYFSFGHKVWLNKNDEYRAKPIITGYSYGSSSHIALRSVWPVPQYPDSFTAVGNDTNLISAPYFLEIFGTFYK